METKLLQLAALMASRDLFAYDSERDKGVAEVRKRWARLHHSAQLRRADHGTYSRA